MNKKFNPMDVLDEFIKEHPDSGVAKLSMNSFSYKMLMFMLNNADMMTPMGRIEIIETLINALTSTIIASVNGNPKDVKILMELCISIMKKDIEKGKYQTYEQFREERI
jgi:hypothetical protein